MFTEQLSKFEAALRDDFMREDYGYNAHAILSECWDFLTHLSTNSTLKNVTQEDILFMGDSYKRNLAALTVDYLEKDFKLRVLSRLNYDSSNNKLDTYVEKANYYICEMLREQPQEN